MGNQHDGEPVGATNVCTRANCDAAASPPTWSIPPDEHDGVEIAIDGKGHIVLTQHRPFEVELTIILHRTEGRRLRKILPAAIAAADQQRKAAI